MATTSWDPTGAGISANPGCTDLNYASIMWSCVLLVVMIIKVFFISHAVLIITEMF